MLNHPLTDTIELANGVTTPVLGLGTWFIPDAQAADAVSAALKLGYRNVDTAQAYGNEAGVGAGVRASGLKREEVFVSTKLAAEIKDYDAAVAAIEGSLRPLDIGYIDLMLIHAPQPWEDFRGGDYAAGNAAAWKAMEKAYQAGHLRAIGVSNFLPADIDALCAQAEVAPQVNQFLVHAGNTPDDVISYCHSHDIAVQAYSPMGHGEILDNDTLRELAATYGVSVPQLCIRYALQLGCIALPKSADPDHMKANAQVEFTIADADMDVLRRLDIRDYGQSARFPVYGVGRGQR